MTLIIELRCKLRNLFLCSYLPLLLLLLLLLTSWWSVVGFWDKIWTHVFH